MARRRTARSRVASRSAQRPALASPTGRAPPGPQSDQDPRALPRRAGRHQADLPRAIQRAETKWRSVLGWTAALAALKNPLSETESPTDKSGSARVRVSGLDENQRSWSERGTAAPAERCGSRCNPGRQARREIDERGRRSVRRSSSAPRRSGACSRSCRRAVSKRRPGVQLGGRGARSNRQRTRRRAAADAQTRKRRDHCRL